MATRSIIALSFIVLITAIQGCAKLGLSAGSAATPNDLPPTNDSVVAQGNFTSVGNVTVTGSVTIYSETGGGYIIRLAGLSIPNESNLEIIPVLGNGEQAAIPLAAETGSKNYEVSYGGNVVWAQVKIRTASTNTDLGLAQLTQVP